MRSTTCCPAPDVLHDSPPSTRYGRGDPTYSGGRESLAAGQPWPHPGSRESLPDFPSSREHSGEPLPDSYGPWDHPPAYKRSEYGKERPIKPRTSAGSAAHWKGTDYENYGGGKGYGNSYKGFNVEYGGGKRKDLRPPYSGAAVAPGSEQHPRYSYPFADRRAFYDEYGGEKGDVPVRYGEQYPDAYADAYSTGAYAEYRTAAGKAADYGKTGAYAGDAYGKQAKQAGAYADAYGKGFTSVDAYSAPHYDGHYHDRGGSQDRGDAPPRLGRPDNGTHYRGDQYAGDGGGQYFEDHSQEYHGAPEHRRLGTEKGGKKPPKTFSEPANATSYSPVFGPNAPNLRSEPAHPNSYSPVFGGGPGPKGGWDPGPGPPGWGWTDNGAGGGPPGVS